VFLTFSEIAQYLTISAGKSHQTILVLLQELEDMIYKLENEKERDIIIDHRFYRNIIGSKGENIREIREMFNQVQITFPGQGKLVIFRGTPMFVWCYYYYFFCSKFGCTS